MNWVKEHAVTRLTVNESNSEGLSVDHIILNELSGKIDELPNACMFVNRRDTLAQGAYIVNKFTHIHRAITTDCVP